MALAKAIKEIKVEQLTAEQLWKIGHDFEKYELVKGELIEMAPPGGTHGTIAVELGSLLRNFVKSKKLGVIMIESGYKLSSQPDTVRGPDISFLSSEKIPQDGIPDGFISGTPDLAIEIVSPHDTASIIQEKVQDYLTYGTRLVWVIYPRQKIVIAHFPDGTSQTLHQDDTLAGEPVILGFSCKIADIFA